MSFIEDDGVVFAEIRVLLRLGQQDAICHELDACFITGVVIEAHLVPYECTYLAAHFLCQAARYGYGSQAAWLSAAKHAGSISRYFSRYLGQLCGFAAAGLTYYDDDLVLPQRCGYFLFMLTDG